MTNNSLFWDSKHWCSLSSSRGWKISCFILPHWLQKHSFLLWGEGLPAFFPSQVAGACFFSSSHFRDSWNKRKISRASARSCSASPFPPFSRGRLPFLPFWKKIRRSFPLLFPDLVELGQSKHSFWLAEETSQNVGPLIPATVLLSLGEHLRCLHATRRGDYWPTTRSFSTCIGVGILEAGIHAKSVGQRVTKELWVTASLRNDFQAHKSLIGLA